MTMRNNQTQKLGCRLSERLFPYFAILSSVFALDYLGLIMVIMQTSKDLNQWIFALI